MPTNDPDTPEEPAGVHVASWNLTCLRADNSLLVPTDAWKSLHNSIRGMNSLCVQLESELDESETHSTQLWFAWGLLDVHVKGVWQVYRKHVTSLICAELEPKLWEIENDIRHMLKCLESEPLGKAVTSRIIDLCFGAFNFNLTNSSRASRTISFYDIPRVKYRNVYISRPVVV